MLKKKYMIIFMGYLAFFFFYTAFKIKAADTFILEKPSASEIVYGEPLYMSDLIGGRTSVEGTFSWENNLQTFEAGEYEVKALFTPTDQNYSSEEVLIHLKVNKRRVYIKFEKDIYKHYDGTNQVNLPNYLVGGIIDKTVYVSGNLEGELESVLIGQNKVILSGLELKGGKKENYYLDLDNVYACVHPKYVEKFGEVKHRVEFGPNTYVPVDSLIYVDEIDDFDISMNGYDVKTVYDIYVKSGNTRLDVGEGSKVRIKVDKDKLDYRRFEMYNYYNGVYEKLDYKYKDGYVEYTAGKGLGKLILAQRKVNYLWIYILLIFAGSGVMVALFSKTGNEKEKIHKYKSLKRGRDNGDY